MNWSSWINAPDGMPENLERAMAEYPGTVLVVVHDRYFIRRFATGIWSLEGQTIHRYLDLEDAEMERRGDEEEEV